MKLDFENDEVALKFLAPHFSEVRNGLLRPITPGYRPNADEIEAIHYLIGEWDFIYED